MHRKEKSMTQPFRSIEKDGLICILILNEYLNTARLASDTKASQLISRIKRDILCEFGITDL